MDDRFPKPLRWLLRRLDWLAIPNLGMLVAGLAVLAFCAKIFLGTPTERFIFDPVLVSQGEWWRLFAFPTELDNPIWLLFYVLYVFFVMGALEEAWGSSPLTIFVLMCYGAAVGGAFLTGRPVSIWYHVMENVSLAFGTVFPDVTLHLFAILPVKAKWLAWLAGGLLGLQFVFGTVETKIFLAVVLLPYFVFFGPMLYRNIRMTVKTYRNRKRFDGDMWR